MSESLRKCFYMFCVCYLSVMVVAGITTSGDNFVSYMIVAGSILIVAMAIFVIVHTIILIKNNIKFKIFFAWYEFWIGGYWDSTYKALYLMLIPMVALKIERKYKNGNSI